MNCKNNIGYIINESGVVMEDVDVIDVKPSGSRFNKNDVKYHSPDRVVGYGILQTANEKNRNGRIYTLNDLKREINAPRQKELLAAGQMLGEQNHPVTNDLTRQQTIDSTNCCVRYHKFWLEGDNICSCFEGTNNELGRVFDKDLRMGIKPAFSLRALGTIKKTPQGIVVDNLKMITYDYVIYPSHPGAYTQGILTENASMASNFRLTDSNDATKSRIIPFGESDMLKAMSKTELTEATKYALDKSRNYNMLKDFFDMSKVNSVNLISSHRVALTESGNCTYVLGLEDYIAKELENYKR